MRSYGRIEICFTTVIVQKTVNFFYSTNKKVIGKFKDEAAGMPIVEFIGLLSKVYSHVKENGKNEKTAKRVRKCYKKEYQS